MRPHTFDLEKGPGGGGEGKGRWELSARVDRLCGLEREGRRGGGKNSGRGGGGDGGETLPGDKLPSIEPGGPYLLPTDPVQTPFDLAEVCAMLLAAVLSPPPPQPATPANNSTLVA